VLDSVTLCYTYTPGVNDTIGDTLCIITCAGAYCDTTIIIIDIIPINDNIVAVDDDVTTDSNTPIVISVLDNDFDTDGNVDPTTVVIITQPMFGTVVVNPNGTITYTPDSLTACGSDSFEYAVSDDGTPLPVTTDTATVTITIIDNVAPIITNCPGDIIDTAMINTCWRQVYWPTPVVTDNCGNTSSNVTITSTFPPGFVFPIGNTVVTITATDVAGNFSTCTFTVTIVDVQAPVFNSCPVGQTLTSTPGACGAIATWPIPTVFDNCQATISVSSSPTTGLVSGSAFPVGTTTVTYITTDPSGLTDTCTFNITVTDTESPVFTNVPTNIIVYSTSANCDIPVSWTEPTVTDNCAVDTVIVSPANGSIFSSVAPTAVTYTATDVNGNVSTYTFTVTVLDTISPVSVFCPSDTTVGNNPGLCGAIVSWPMPVATDNCGNVTYTLTSQYDMTDVIPVGQNIITYNIADLAGNTISCSFNLTVLDITAPIITNCPSNIIDTASINSCWTQVYWPTPIVTDNCGNSVLNVSVTSNIPNGYVFPIGDTTVTITATDASGNSSTCTFTVTIVDVQAPVFNSCPLGQILTNTPGACGAIATWQVPTVFDNCQFTTTITSSPTTGLASGSLFPVGTSTITYITVDGSGLSDTCTFTIIVSDTEYPVILNSPTDLTVYISESSCEVVVTWAEPTATDNCGLQSWNPSTGGTFSVGETSVSHTAIDINGNITSEMFIVTVLDTISPVSISCPTNITVANDLGVCGAAVNWPLPVATDNCGDVNYTLVSQYGPMDIIPVGTWTIVYSIEDESGNTLMCEFDVTVEDSEAPVIVGGPSVNVNGCTNSLVNWQEPTATDNCNGSAVFTVTSSPTPALNNGDVFPIGTTTMTYTTVDSSGNVSTFTFDVVVAPAPTVSIAGAGSVTLCRGENASISVETPSLDYTYSWSLYNYVIGTGPSYTFESVTESDNGFYSVTATDTTGCTAQATTQVIVGNCGIIIPEAITPNGNGQNDVFFIQNLDAYPNTEVIIFNRWGSEVFESKDYKNDWSGVSQNKLNVGGNQLPEGTYFYVIKLGGKELDPGFGKIYKGYVYIKK